MGLRRSWLAVLVLALAGTAGADSHKTEEYTAVSYANESDLYGLQISLFRTMPWGVDEDSAKADEHKAHPMYRWGLVADGGIHWAKHDEREWTLALGARYVIYGWPDPTRPTCDSGCRNNLMFTHVMLGATSTRKNGTDETAGAVIVGAGYDRVLGKKTWAIRTQADLVFPTGHDLDPYPRLSIGVVVRGGHMHASEPHGH